MAERDESAAIGAEKSPRKVGLFLLVLFIVLAIALGLTLFLGQHPLR